MSRTYNVKHTYTGTGALASYTFDFKITALTQLLVVVANADGDEVQRVRGDDVTYLSSVTFDANDGGGTVVLQANLTSGHTMLLLLADDSPTQSYEFRNKTSFTLRRFEDAMDYIAGAVQRLVYRANKALRLHDLDDEAVFDPTLPSGIASNADRVIQVNSTGTGLEYGPLSGDIGGSLPVVGAAGEYLESDGADAIWQDGVFSGYSARFSTAFSATGIRNTLLAILNFSYLAPLVTLDCSASDDDVIREKGDAVIATTLSATITKRTDPLARIRYLLNSVLVAGGDYNPPASLDSQTHTHAWTGSFSDTSTFTVEVTDDGTSGGPTTTSATSTFTFVYPYYSGEGAAALTAAQVAALTKDIRLSTASLNKVFTPVVGEVLYFAYPASYGALTSIIDENGFETIGDWTLRTENITGLDATAQSYRIYEFNNPFGAAVTTNYTFIR